MVELHPEALAELRNAAVWYDAQPTGLGDEFVAEVVVALGRVDANKTTFPFWPGVGSTAAPIRRALLERFPYAIAFEVRGNDVFVLAIAHTRRRPLYWLSRAR